MSQPPDRHSLPLAPPVRKLRIESSAACQLHCPACPRATGEADPVIGRGYLRFDNFRRLVEGSPRLKQVELSNYGELFLNPDLLAIMELARQRGIALTGDNGTNFNRVPEAVLEGLVRLGFARLTCAIDGVTAATYARYRVGGDLAAVLANIRQLNHWKDEYGTDRPLLTWQFIAMPHNRHEVDEARRLAASLRMRFSLKLGWDQPGADAESSLRRAYRERVGVEYTRAICFQLWTMPQLNWDGRVLGCSRNFWGEFGGNAFVDGIDAVANGERMRYARGMLLGHNPPRPDIPCSTCEQYHALRDARRWLRPSETRLTPRAQRWAYEHGVAHPATFVALGALARAANAAEHLRIRYVQLRRPRPPQSGQQTP